MTIPQTFPSGFSTGVNSTDRLVNPVESIGQRRDGPATDIDENNSIFALLKGIGAELSLPEGSGMGAIHTTRLLVSGEAAAGSPSDERATDADGVWSAISIGKGILRASGVA